MTTTTAVAGAVAPVPAYPRPVVIPRVQGDAAAARRLAAAYADAADDVALVRRRLTAVDRALDRAWAGGGAGARHHPVTVVVGACARTERSLRDAAATLEAYGRRLDHAHEHHGFSLGKLVAIGAVITVTAAAVVVTMGAAAVVAGTAEAAVAAGAISGAETAAGAALAAEAAAASDLASSCAAMAGVRALVAFAAPHLVQAELSAGLAGVGQEWSTGRLTPRGMEVAGVSGFVGSATSGAAVRASAAFGAPALRFLAPHLATGLAWGAVDGVEQLATTGDLSVSELMMAGGFAAATSVTGRLLARPSLVASAHLDETAHMTVAAREERWGDPATLIEHFDDHAADFGIADVLEYARFAQAFLGRALAERLPMLIDKDGTVRAFDPASKTFASYNPDGTTRTVFIPRSRSGRPAYADDYWERQPGIDFWGQR